MSSSAAALLGSLRRAEEGAALDDPAAGQLIRRLKRRRPAATNSPETAAASVTRLGQLLDKAPTPASGSRDEDGGRSAAGVVEEALPEHLRRLRSGLAFVQDSLVELPLLRMLSPRSMRLAERLPAPGAGELVRLGEVQGSPYDGLVEATDRRRARELRMQRPRGSRVQSGRAGRAAVPVDGSCPAVGSPAGELFDRTRRAQRRARELEERMESATFSVAAAVPELHGLVAGVYDELGVDLDPRFNRLRRLRAGVEVVALFWGRERCRVGFQHLLEQCRRSSVALTDRSGRLLVRIARGFLARLHCRFLRAHVERQRESERRRRKERTTHLLNVLCTMLLLNVKLQRRVRSFRARRKWAAATAIARIWRGYCLRRTMVGAVAQMLLRISASTSIQCAFRRYVASRKVVSLSLQRHPNAA